MYVKKSCLGSLFSRSWAGLLGYELCQSIVLRGLIPVQYSRKFGFRP
jgi:hypothetical protein